MYVLQNIINVNFIMYHYFVFAVCSTKPISSCLRKTSPLFAAILQRVIPSFSFKGEICRRVVVILRKRNLLLLHSSFFFPLPYPATSSVFATSFSPGRPTGPMAMQLADVFRTPRTHYLCFTSDGFQQLCIIRIIKLAGVKSRGPHQKSCEMSC